MSLHCKLVPVQHQEDEHGLFLAPLPECPGNDSSPKPANEYVMLIIVQCPFKKASQLTTASIICPSFLNRRQPKLGDKLLYRTQLLQKRA